MPDCFADKLCVFATLGGVSQCWTLVEFPAKTRVPYHFVRNNVPWYGGSQKGNLSKVFVQKRTEQFWKGPINFSAQLFANPNLVAVHWCQSDLNGWTCAYWLNCFKPSIAVVRTFCQCSRKKYASGLCYTKTYVALHLFCTLSSSLGRRSQSPKSWRVREKLLWEFWIFGVSSTPDEMCGDTYSWM